MDKLEEIEKEEKFDIEIVLFNIEELEKSLTKIKIKCLEPFMDNNSNQEENKELYTFFLYIKESFKTLNKLQNLIKEIS